MSSKLSKTISIEFIAQHELAKAAMVAIFVILVLLATNATTSATTAYLKLTQLQANLTNPKGISALNLRFSVPAAQINKTCVYEAAYYNTGGYCLNIVSFVNFTLPGNFIGYYRINVTFINDKYNQTGWLFVPKNATNQTAFLYGSRGQIFANSTDVSRTTIVATDGFAISHYTLAIFNVNTSSSGTVQLNVTKYVEYSR